MSDDAIYQHSDIRRMKELGGWIVGAVMGVMAATGFLITLQRDVHDLQQTALVREARLAELERGGNVTATRLASVESKLDTLIGLLQPGTETQPARPTSAPRR